MVLLKRMLEQETLESALWIPTINKQLEKDKPIKKSVKM